MHPHNILCVDLLCRNRYRLPIYIDEEKQLTVDYDTNYSLATLIHSSHMMNPSPSTLALIEASESKSGLSLVDVAVAKYSFDGAAQQMQYQK